MSVAFDANATAATDTSAVSTISNTTLTVGSGANRVLIAQLAFGDAVPSAITVNWDAGGTPQAMTQLVSKTVGTQTLQLWGLINPTAGNKTLTASWTTAAECIINATSFTGANQNNILSAFKHAISLTNTSTKPAIAVHSMTGNITVDLNCGFGGLESAPSKTQLYIKAGIGPLNCGSSYSAGADSNSHAWTLDANVAWISVGIDIQQAETDGPLPLNRLRPHIFSPGLAR